MQSVLKFMILQGERLQNTQCALKNEVYNNSYYSYSMRYKCWVGYVLFSHSGSNEMVKWFSFPYVGLKTN